MISFLCLSNIFTCSWLDHEGWPYQWYLARRVVKRKLLKGPSYLKALACFGQVDAFASELGTPLLENLAHSSRFWEAAGNTNPGPFPMWLCEQCLACGQYGQHFNFATQKYSAVTTYKNLSMHVQTWTMGIGLDLPELWIFPSPRKHSILTVMCPIGAYLMAWAWPYVLTDDLVSTNWKMSEKASPYVQLTPENEVFLPVPFLD